MATERRYMIMDGELLAWQPLDGAYIYQNIHTLDYRPRHLAHHAEILQRLSQELFGVESSLSASTLQEQITRLLTHLRPSRQRSVCAVVKQYASGSYTIECDTPSLYSGYVLRSLRPEAAMMRVTMPLETFPTSASIATREVADSIAHSHDFHTAILMNDAGEICSEASQPIAIVQGLTLILSPTPYSVESEVVEQIAKRTQLKVERRTISHDDIVQADEVLTISWQGITAMQKIDGKRYMSIVAERLAREMERFSNL